MILLDTPSLIRWVARDAALSPFALGCIERQRPGGRILICAISAWEIALWVDQGVLALRMNAAAWLAALGNVPEIRFVPVDNALALEAAALPGPAPASLPARLILATARQFGCALITADPALRAYEAVKTIW